MPEGRWAILLFCVVGLALSSCIGGGGGGGGATGSAAGGGTGTGTGTGAGSTTGNASGSTTGSTAGSAAGSNPLGGLAAAPVRGQRDVAGEDAAPADPTDPQSWRTFEFLSCGRDRTCGEFLNLIGADRAYASLAARGLETGGAGVSIAIVDTGIRSPSPETPFGPGTPGSFDGNFDISNPGIPTSDREHGTYVASVAAGRRDGQGMHGVAYRANLLSLGMHEDHLTTDFTAAAIASGAGSSQVYGRFRSTARASAHIISLSLSTIKPQANPQGLSARAMRLAAQRGRIIVASLGNLDETGVRENAPRRTALGEPVSLVATSGIAGSALAVGALDVTGQAYWDKSKFCGPVREYCLFAPGEYIPATHIDHPTLAVRFSGTSVAVPIVSGAAAVLTAAFPHKPSTAIVRRLLDTARPLDGLEVSPIYGHGALDLAAAVEPWGDTGFRLTTTSDMRSISSSRMRVSSAYGAPGDLATLGEAVVYDAQGFPFQVALDSLFDVNADLVAHPLSDFLTPPGSAMDDAPATAFAIGRGEALRFTLRGADEVRAVGDARARATRVTGTTGTTGTAGETQHMVDMVQMNFRPTEALSITLGDGVGRDGAALDFARGRAGRLAFADDGGASSIAALAGESEGVHLDWKTGGNSGRNSGSHAGERTAETRLSFSAASGDGLYGEGATRIAAAGLTHRLAGQALTLGLRYGVLYEERALLGLQAGGAFAGLNGGDSRFMNFGFDYRLRPDVSFYGAFSNVGVAGTDVGDGPSLVTDWGRAEGQAWAVGAEFHDLFRAADRLTVTASAPLRMTADGLRLRIPEREIADQQAVWVDRTLSLTPGGRERRLQTVYEIGLGAREQLKLSTSGYIRLEPGHDPTAAPDYGLAARLHLNF